MPYLHDRHLSLHLDPLLVGLFLQVASGENVAVEGASLDLYKTTNDTILISSDRKKDGEN